jgi:methylaspartate mutase sigma subunit
VSSALLGPLEAGSGADPRQAPAGRRDALDIVLTTTASDCHTWNLVFLQMLMEEEGHRVTNLGACVPEDLLVAHCRERTPDLIVVSTVNGHGYFDGLRLIKSVRSAPELAAVPAIIGGKLGVSGMADAQRSSALMQAGFNAVFEDEAGVGRLRSLLDRLPAGTAFLDSGA